MLCIKACAPQASGGRASRRHNGAISFADIPFRTCNFWSHSPFPISKETVLQLSPESWRLPVPCRTSHGHQSKHCWIYVGLEHGFESNALQNASHFGWACSAERSCRRRGHWRRAVTPSWSTGRPYRESELSREAIPPRCNGGLACLLADLIAMKPTGSR